MTNHTNHNHPATPAARAACRKANTTACGCGSPIVTGIIGPENNPTGACGPTYCHWAY